MKKIYYVFVFLFLAVFMTSCKPNKVDELNDFLNSHVFEMTIKTIGTEEDVDILKIVGTKKAVLIETLVEVDGMNKVSIIIDKDNNLFYLNDNKTIHTKLENDNLEVDPYEYITNIQENNDGITFDFDINKYKELFDESFADILPDTDKINIACTFNEAGKISELKYNYQEITMKIQVHNYSNKKKDDPEDLGIEEISVPKIEDCRTLTYEEFLEYLENGIVASSIQLEVRDITYGFKIDDYIYLCDKRYLYKYEKNSNKLCGKLDLQCRGISHYVKGEYLYVAAHFPYTSTFNDSDAYDGSVTKIKLSDFTIDKQVHVECLPESIIVDNRDNVILSKGANQHVYCSQVDMETGALSDIFKSYQDDKLLYDPINDVIILITVSISSNNEVYKYNGSEWVKDGYSSIEQTGLYYNGENSYVTRYGIYEFNSFTKDYVFDEFDYEFPMFTTLRYVTADKEKAYILYSDIFEEVNTEYIILFDIETDTYKTIEIPSAYCAEIKFAYVDSGILYMVSKSGSIIKMIV